MKFFVMLLVFSLVPLIAVTSFGKHSMMRLSRAISGEAYTNLTNLTCESLEQTAQSAAKILLLSKQSLELATFSLAYEAERLLAEDPPAQAGKIYFAQDYDHEPSAPEDFAASERHWKKDELVFMSIW